MYISSVQDAAPGTWRMWVDSDAPDRMVCVDYEAVVADASDAIMWLRDAHCRTRPLCLWIEYCDYDAELVSRVVCAMGTACEVVLMGAASLAIVPRVCAAVPTHSQITVIVVDYNGGIPDECMDGALHAAQRAAAQHAVRFTTRLRCGGDVPANDTVVRAMERVLRGADFYTWWAFECVDDHGMCERVAAELARRGYAASLRMVAI